MLIRSWVASANRAETDFPLNNLPCGVFAFGDDEPHCGVAIGDMILDVTALEEVGILKVSDEPVLDVPFWNDFMELGPKVWKQFRKALTELLAEGSSHRAEVEPFLVPMDGAEMMLPFLVRNIRTSMRAGITRSMWGPCSVIRRMPCPRTGCIFPSATTGGRRRWWCRARRCPQALGPDQGAGGLPGSVFAPSRRFDIELEMGAVVGRASEGMVSVAERTR
jgi:fumarylacetoacetase